MSGFCVKFFNTLLSSDGHPRKVLQRTIELTGPKTAQDAARIAQDNFERLEGVADWRLHSQCCEVEAKDEVASEEIQRGSKASARSN